MRTRRRGFTLIELLMVVVIIGILAAIGIPKFAAAKGRAGASRLRSDLRNLATAEEGYFYLHGNYTPTLTDLAPDFVPSAGTTMTLQTAGGGWSAKATGASTNSTCALFYNSPPVAPATQEGQIACDN